MGYYGYLYLGTFIVLTWAQVVWLNFLHAMHAFIAVSLCIITIYYFGDAVHVKQHM